LPCESLFYEEDNIKANGYYYYYYYYYHYFITFLLQAGIGSMTNPGQLIIALEPETAALFCMERKISKLETERASDLEDAKLTQPQTQYMVVDIGGQ